VLRYLGRYTHPVAISNHRLTAFDGERVTFRWKDYAHGNPQRWRTLPATEFLRRYVQHICRAASCASGTTAISPIPRATRRSCWPQAHRLHAQTA